MKVIDITKCDNYWCITTDNGMATVSRHTLQSWLEDQLTSQEQMINVLCERLQELTTVSKFA